MTSVRRRFVAVAAVVALSVAAVVAGPAAFALPSGSAAPRGRAAVSDARLGLIKARGDAAVAAREATLEADGSLAAAATHLSDSDRAALEALVADNEAGLAQLRQTIDSDSQVSEAQSDVASIVTSFRIYTLVDPKVHLVIAADRGAAAVAGFGPLVATLGAVRGGSPPTLFAQLQQDVAAAAAVISEVPGQVLLLTPAGYPANRSTLVAAAGSLATARADLGRAAADAQTIITDVGAG